MALYLTGYILGAIGLGTLAAALNKLLRGRPRIFRTAMLTALLLLAQFWIADVLHALQIEDIRPQAHLLTPYFWTLGIARVAAGTIVGTICGHWIINKLVRPN